MPTTMCQSIYHGIMAVYVMPILSVGWVRCSQDSVCGVYKEGKGEKKWKGKNREDAEHRKRRLKKRLGATSIPTSTSSRGERSCLVGFCAEEFWLIGLSTFLGCKARYRYGARFLFQGHVRKEHGRNQQNTELEKILLLYRRIFCAENNSES